MAKKLLIFDLDGTLADTLHTIRDAVNMCFEHYGYPRKSYEEVRVNVGSGVRALIGGLLPADVAREGERFEEIMDYFSTCYLKTHDDLDGCYDGLFEVIKELHGKGYKLAVLSNKPDRLVKGIIKKLFPDGEFSMAMGQTELPRKPDPTVPLMIAAELGCRAEDSCFIGDSEVDVQTAKNAGMRSIAVSWGFRDRDMLVAAAPDCIADTPAQLAELL